MEQEKKKSNKKKTVTDNLCGLSELQFKEIYKSIISYSSIQDKSSGIIQAIFGLLLKHGNDWIFTDNDTSIYKMMWSVNDNNKIFKNSDSITKFLIPKKTAEELKESNDIILLDLNYDPNTKGNLLDNILTSREDELNIIFSVHINDINKFNILNPAVINIVEVEENNFFDTFNKIKSGINSFKRGNKPLVVLNQTSGTLALENFENYLKEHKILSKKELDAIKEETSSNPFEAIEESNAYELSGDSDDLLVIIIGKSKLNDEVQKLYSNDLKFKLLTVVNISEINQSLVCNLVDRCGKVLIVRVHSELDYISNEVLRMIVENCFENLDAGVKIVNSNDLEEIKNRISELINY